MLISVYRLKILIHKNVDLMFYLNNNKDFCNNEDIDAFY